MKRVLLKISYLGTAYHGWQVQPNGITVQEEMQNALEKMYKVRPNLTGCSRTDAGVHANEFYCHFDTNLDINERGIVLGLNALLPSDISVLDAKYVENDFHARYNAKGKNYIYRIYNSEIKNPFLADRTLQIARELDIEKMNEFCKRICGKHDFYGFSSSGRSVTDTIRTITECSVSKEGKEVILSVTADGFLYNMVRIVTGTAIAVSDGLIDPKDTESIILSKDRDKAGATVAPWGLYLNKVFY